MALTRHLDRVRTLTGTLVVFTGLVGHLILNDNRSGIRTIVGATMRFSFSCRIKWLRILT